MKKGSKHAPSTLWKLSIAGKKRKHSLETKEKMSQSHQGLTATEETKEKIRQKALGRKVSETTKVKIREARAKQVVTPAMKEALISHRRWIDGRTLDPAYVSWSKNRWHHRRRNAEGAHTYEEWEAIKLLYKHTCPSCLRKEPEIKLSVDHIVPLTKGGTNNIDNVQPLCRNCNSKKSNKIIKFDLPA